MERKSLHRRSFLAGTAALAASTRLATAQGEPVRIGIIAPFSGQFAVWGKQFREAMDVYVALNGDSVGGRKLEFIWKDLPAPNAQAARAIAQEAIVRDRVSYLGGLVFTPDAIAVAPVIDELKVPTVIFNAATSGVPARSRYFARTSFTLSQISVPAAQWMARQGIKRVITTVTDYAPGVDAETSFRKEAEALGITVMQSIRMPLATTDFTAFAQRVRNEKPEAVYVFLPAGPPTFAYVKAYAENGLQQAGIRFVGTGETDETNLAVLGDAALGLYTSYHYSAAHPGAANKRFTDKLAELHPRSVANFMSVGAHDGLHLITRMIAATGGASNPDAAMAAVAGLTYDSPRGPIRIDRDSRDIVQNIYIRIVEKNAAGQLINREIETIPMVADGGRSQPA
jgi:branched-chain amino acid transport system substrate-binding protein